MTGTIVLGLSYYATHTKSDFTIFGQVMVTVGLSLCLFGIALIVFDMNFIK